MTIWFNISGSGILKKDLLRDIPGLNLPGETGSDHQGFDAGRDRPLARKVGMGRVVRDRRGYPGDSRGNDHMYINKYEYVYTLYICEYTYVNTLYFYLSIYIYICICTYTYIYIYILGGSPLKPRY